MEKKRKMIEELGLDKMSVVNIDQFFSKLFEARDILHLTHIKSPQLSYAQHKALGHAYEDMIGIVDSLIEGYTGLYYCPKIKLVEVCYVENPLKYAESFYKMLKEGRNLFADSWILNEIDELMKIFAKLIYKLKYLK